MKNQKGITLVALVITIIVLLILAAVTIAALGGSNGILTNAARAKQENAIGNAKDIVNLTINEATNAYYTSTYATASTSDAAKVVAGNQAETAAKFIATMTNKPSDVTITVYEKTTGDAPDQVTTYSVVIATKDNDKAYLSATINSDGGITWATDITGTDPAAGSALGTVYTGE